MWELYVEHPIVGEVFLTVVFWSEIKDYPDEVDGLPVKCRYSPWPKGERYEV